MKKIVVVSFNGIDNAGGLERVTQYICQALKGCCNISIFKKKNLQFPKIDFFIQGIIMNLRLNFVKQDFVVSNSWQSYRYPADIVFFHGTIEGYLRKIGKFRKFSSSGLMAHMEKTAARKAKKIIAVSNHVKDELSELYGLENSKITVLPNCVDDGIYVPVENNARKEKKVILFSGRLEYGKGLPSLRALSDFLETISGWNLCIAANTHQNEHFFLEKKNTKLYFGLTADEMPRFYQSGDVLFFPSLYEGFSMASIEALSCGIPIMGTDYVITSELSNYEFCKNCNDFIMEPQKIVENAMLLHKVWNDKKEFIHETIKKDFGIQQWKNKFLRTAFYD